MISRGGKGKAVFWRGGRGRRKKKGKKAEKRPEN